jgi:hypothetical protein
MEDDIIYLGTSTNNNSQYMSFDSQENENSVLSNSSNSTREHEDEGSWIVRFLTNDQYDIIGETQTSSKVSQISESSESNEKDANEKLLCTICYDKIFSVACGHVICKNCDLQMKTQCPFCLRKIEKKLKLYF